MSHPAGRKASLMRWWAFLSVVVVATASSSCVDAKVENRLADGFLESGYFFPKTLLWHGIRQPPGIYWFVYVCFAGAVYFSLMVALINLLISHTTGQESEDSYSDQRYYRDVINIYLVPNVVTSLEFGLLYVGVAAVNLSDVLQAYLIGMCIVQVLVDTLRTTISSDLEDHTGVLYTVAGFQISSALGIALLDSYRPLNVMNLTYFICGIIIRVLIAAGTAGKTQCNKVLGFYAGLFQMAFCVAAFIVANRVAGVNKSQTLAFLITAIANFVIVSIISFSIPSSESSDNNNPTGSS